MPQLTRGAIRFLDAPEPVLALRRDVAGLPGLVALFNLGAHAVHFELPDLAGAVALSEPGLPGVVVGRQASLPAFGAWFGLAHIAD